MPKQQKIHKLKLLNDVERIKDTKDGPPFNCP